ncbi:hypothetical protein SS50377_21110 [Spironucleus salmonicida]|uniref:Uncharacterized protein n=1 Tax=Spironucleus salmonicida TaxID=348837 RepID=A0A9P8M0H0_9EUKA|nr:hypothetical protein SS50377_21110 [Spironucleus salmonicida]
MKVSSIQKEILQLKDKISNIETLISTEKNSYEKQIEELSKVYIIPNNSHQLEENIDLNQLKAQDIQIEVKQLHVQLEEVKALNARYNSELKQVELVRQSQETYTEEISQTSRLIQIPEASLENIAEDKREDLSKDTLLHQFYQMNNQIQNLIQTQSDQ